MTLVDFHMHTTVSDGVWSPEDLMRYVRDAEIQVLSVTDHDTMDGYPFHLESSACFVSGMEVDTKCDGATAHLLVYGIRSPEAPLLTHLRAQRAARRERMEEMIERLLSLGVEISMGDVEAEAGAAASLGRPHLARALLKRGVVSSTQEAFDRYLADDRDGFVSLERLESSQAIALAHASGAIVSVAHPARLRNPGSLEMLREAGVDGIEVIHPSADPAMRAELRDFASTHRLLVTGGSDFHSPATDKLPGIHLDDADVEAFLVAVERVSGAEFGSKSAWERTGATA